ncbi:MAG: hypothetical protein WC874_04635 [Candidatus Izemoplasmatales bacterium]
MLIIRAKSIFVVLVFLAFISILGCTTCGDMICSTGENSSNCCRDCGCEDGTNCDITTDSCVINGSCGNGVCNYEMGESSLNCRDDCYTPPADSCGNGSCEPQYGENETNCGKDCATGNVKAVVLVDQRLYALLKNEIDSYISVADERRDFNVLLKSDESLDDYNFVHIREILKQYKHDHPEMEGALFIGNIKLPSFYSPRSDNYQTRLFSAYYEDLDMNLGKFYASGSTRTPSVCAPGDSCENTLINGTTVPEHDFDYLLCKETCNNKPDIWTAYMPVGKLGATTYNDFANQLKPYFAKLMKFYDGTYAPNEKMYAVSTDLMEDKVDFWQLYDNVTKVDFYSINPDKYDATNPDADCMNPSTGATRTAEECYVRAPLENYPDFNTFKTEYHNRAKIGDRWDGQWILDSIYTKQMEANNYEFVMAGWHGSQDWGIIDSSEARELENGGMIMLGCGCSIAGFNQPGSVSSVDVYNYAHENLLMSYLWGNSNFLAAIGDSFNRGHFPEYQEIINAMKNNRDYLGKAHLKQMQRLYGDSTSAYNLKENMQEMLLGDPFLDVAPK